MKWTVLAIIATSFIRSGFATPIFTSPTHPIVLADLDTSLSGNRTPNWGRSTLPLVSSREITVPSNQSPITAQVQESVSPPQDVPVVTSPKSRQCKFIGLLKKFCGFPTSPQAYLKAKSAQELRQIIEQLSRRAYIYDNQTDDAIDAHILLIDAMVVLFKRIQEGEPIQDGDGRLLAQFNEHFNSAWLELYNKNVLQHWRPWQGFFARCKELFPERKQG